MKTSKMQSLVLGTTLLLAPILPGLMAHGHGGGGGGHHRGGHHRQHHGGHQGGGYNNSTPTAQGAAAPTQPHYQNGVTVQPANNTPAPAATQPPASTGSGENHDRR